MEFRKDFRGLGRVETYSLSDIVLLALNQNGSRISI